VARDRVAIFSGLAGSALGAVLFSKALQHGNATVVNVVLNVQPVLSTTAACLLLRPLARCSTPGRARVIAGMVLVGATPWTYRGIDAGTGYALACALCWGLSTVPAAASWSRCRPRWRPAAGDRG